MRKLSYTLRSVSFIQTSAKMWNYLCFTALVFTSNLIQNAEMHPVHGVPKARNQSSPYPFYNEARMLQLPLRPVDDQLISKWTSTALKFFDFHRCIASNIASSEDECFRLNQIDRSEVAVYFGGANNNLANPPFKSGKHENSYKRDHKVVAIFPDSNTAKAGGTHDAILVLDPYPNANFGHLVAVFYIDLGMDSRKCKEEFQIYTTDETCITVAKKPRCPNRLERYTGGGLQPRRCHIDFLPTVYLAERFTTSSGSSSANVTSTHLGHDLLNCINLSGFASCPIFRPVDDTRRVLCDGTAVNSKRCDTSHAGVGTRCKLFQTCDRAVLVGGGWNRLHSDVKSFENIVKTQESLSSMGFLPENIKTFYANGKSRATSATGRGGRSMYDDSSYLSSAMKTGLRGHIRTICETRHCADTLYIYLNNPTTFEGDMLLWDVDYNGMVDELEVYTVKEFLSDILGCEARRVVLIVDQSNSDVLLSNLKESTEHKNVVLFTAGLPNQATTNGELTSLWAKHSQSSTCIKYIHQNVKTSMIDSSPVNYDSTSGISSKVSLIGAPCDLNPPVNSRELKTLYEGCQNVPTSIWFSATFEDVAVPDYDSQGNADESEENSPNGRRV